MNCSMVLPRWSVVSLEYHEDECALKSPVIMGFC